MICSPSMTCVSPETSDHRPEKTTLDVYNTLLQGSQNSSNRTKRNKETESSQPRAFVLASILFKVSSEDLPPPNIFSLPRCSPRWSLILLRLSALRGGQPTAWYDEGIARSNQAQGISENSFVERPGWTSDQVPDEGACLCSPPHDFLCF